VDQAEEFLHRFWQKYFEILQPETRPRFWLQNLNFFFARNEASPNSSKLRQHVTT
jgi:hypothetical protein